jgi:hypothetical protein
VRERVLSVSLRDVVQLFELTKWKFFEVDEEDGVVRVEVPRGSGECFVVELSYGGDQGVLESLTKTLRGADFIRQTVRVRSDW